ncbi:MAG: cobyrinate a,c-diamide synthase [bacterium]
MLYTIPRVVIAGLKGGSGKTTLSLGLLSAFRKEGKKIIPFKKGPDYIDAGWLARASGQECHNLDAFLFPEEIILDSFVKSTSGSGGALIEGNRGIFDGIDEKGTFSTAQLSKILSSPVILIVDCAKATTTIAALIKGIIEYDQGVNIRGVVLNQVAGPRHEAVIRKAIESNTGVKVIGSIGKAGDDILLERHMGLVPFQEAKGVGEVLKKMARLIAQSVEISAVEDIMKSAPDIEVPVPETEPPAVPKKGDVRIGVLKDAAFQFYYPENIRLLSERGATVVEINALTQENLPDVDALYIGGGFPETHTVDLAKNRKLLVAIKKRAENGLPVYAECGGLMYLGRQIEIEGKKMKMVGLLPLEFSMQHKPAAHGYTEVEVTDDNPYYPVGTELKGHEFHYSSVTRSDNTVKLVFKMKRGNGIKGGYDGLVYKNVLATYTHLHALGSPQWVEGMIRVARRYKDNR